MSFFRPAVRCRGCQVGCGHYCICRQPPGATRWDGCTSNFARAVPSCLTTKELPFNKPTSTGWRPGEVLSRTGKCYQSLAGKADRGLHACVSLRVRFATCVCVRCGGDRRSVPERNAGLGRNCPDNKTRPRIFRTVPKRYSVLLSYLKHS